MSIPRKHHYLPRFYLEGFRIEPQKGKKSHIWQINKYDEQHHFSPAIDDTGCIRDFHTIDLNDEEPDHITIEASLSRLESEQAALVQSILKTNSIDVSQIEMLSLFISMMRYRVPSFATHIEKSLQSVVLDTFKIMYQNGQLNNPPEEIKKLIEEKSIDEAIKVDISNWKILSHMFEVALSPESLFHLSEYNYHLYIIDNDEMTFVTSDNPIALYHPDYDKIKPYGVGLAMGGVELTFPLTSRILICAGLDVERGYSIADTEKIKKLKN